MSAVLAQPDRFATFKRPDLSEDEKLKRVQITARLISRFRKSRVSDMDGVSYRCTVCGGRVDVYATPNGGSRGKCRTANCLSWEEAGHPLCPSRWPTHDAGIAARRRLARCLRAHP